MPHSISFPVVAVLVIPPLLSVIQIQAVTLNDVDEFCKNPSRLSPGGKESSRKTAKVRHVQEFLKFLERRLTFDYRKSEPYHGLPSNAKEAPKLELFDHAIEITMVACPKWLVSHDFLKIFQELFTSLFMWAPPDSLQLESGLLSSIWKVVNFEASRCKQRLNNSEDFQTIVRDAYIIMRDDPAFEPSYFKGRGGGGELNAEKNHWNFKEDKNVIIEFAWLLANHVAAVCHAVSKHTYNFWPNFVRLFNQVYLKPLATEWNDPNQNSDYQFLLGGFDYQVEYEKLGFCATQAFKMTLNLVPFPKEFLVDISGKGETNITETNFF